MSDLLQRLSERKTLDDTMRAAIEREFGLQGKKALAAIDTHRVKKYLDFFVVTGKTDDYIVDDNVCTCRDFIFRNRKCWHLLAVHIATISGLYDSVDLWYQETWKNKGAIQ